MNLDPALTPYLIATFAIGTLVGVVINALLSKARQNRAFEDFQQPFVQHQALLEQQVADAKQQAQGLQSAFDALRNEQMQSQSKMGELNQKAEQLYQLQQERLEWQTQLNTAKSENADLMTRLESQRARYEQEQEASKEKIELLENAEKRLQEQFENLANKIFEQKNEKFSQTSKAGLDALLTPLKDQIEGFKKQVSDQYVKEGQERASLKTEILGLKELNKQITEEASALTRALKGDNKQQGNWGEAVLERILTESGLREGHEYEKQVSIRDESGKLYQPDIVVHLPNEKDIVIDSKVTLSAYERYFHEEDESQRQTHLSEHITSLKTHLKDLGKKDYQDLPGLRTLDYVLMFVPVEAAFLLAIDESPDLVKQALDNNIMIVSPTNLLVALRTINNIWQIEYQNQNAKKIADNASKMYDKFVAFGDDMLKLGENLQTVQKRYDGAMNKLTEGRGNLVKRAEELRKLGVQANKQQDKKLLEKTEQDEAEE